MEICTLSSFKNNYFVFNMYANLVYDTTNFISNDYPGYKNWFWYKHIPRVLCGCGEIVMCTLDGNLIGITALKKYINEHKICTIYVCEEYRRRRIATAMLHISFMYLFTTKPIISIPSYKVPMFEKIITKYNWVLTRISNSSRMLKEYIYNESIFL